MAKRKRTYYNVTINVNSNESVKRTKLYGVLSTNDRDPNDSGIMNFDETDDDKQFIIVGERKWTAVKVKRDFGLRVTKNKQTGEYRITFTLTPERIREMNLREIGQYEAELGLTLEKIAL